MKKLILFIILIGLRHLVVAQHSEQLGSKLILGNVSPSLMYSLDPNEQIDSLGLIEAKILKNNEGRFLQIESAFAVTVIEISIHKKNGDFKEHIMNEKLASPLHEMLFLFPDTDTPTTGNILRIKLNGLTRYYTFLEW